MFSGKLETTHKLFELAALARRGDKFFADELCNFYNHEFDLKAVVLFKILKEYTLEVFGKSQTAKKIYTNNSIHKCPECSLLKDKQTFTINSESNCSVTISDFSVNEYCFIIPLLTGQDVLLKIAKETALNPSEKDNIEKSLNLISVFLSTWDQCVTGLVKPSSNFSQIVTETAQELKNNSNAIISIVNTLGNENFNALVSDNFNLIKKNAQGVLLNINDLNELAKIESSSITKTEKKVDIASFTNEIVSAFRKSLAAKNINFIVNIDKLLNHQILVDEQKLRYVLTSTLFIASTLAIPGDITLKISITTDNKIRFHINNAAREIDNLTLRNFFEPYYLSRLDIFKSTNVTGLSPALIKSYISFLGGDISVSNTAKGNSFTFTISGDVMSEFESTLSQLPKPTTKNKVLVVEDDYATSKLLNNYLNKWGYDPTIVNTEEQAFRIVEKEPLLAVILDIELPNINGLELLKKFHEHPKTKNIPVIVCSVEPEQQKAFMMGAVEYFIKPINYNYLVEVLTSYKLRKNSNVLCVDDDLPTLNLVKQAIEQAGFNPIAINFSATVMGIIKDKDIDLAIVDLDMPEVNGFELIKLIKSEKKFANLPIIIYTGKENYKDDLYKIEGLFEDLLDKRSTNMEDLADTISAMINRYEVPPSVEEITRKDNVIKILLAEDYKHSQIIVTRLLKKNGFENVVVVENGEDALKSAQDQQFNLILMDMQMPIMNGFEATEKIREISSYKNVPIIALTAFAMKGDREKCLESGATDYIPKPIDSKEFIDKVKYYTNSLS